MKALKLILLILAIPLLAQEEVLSEKFENGIPETWEVKTNNDKRKWYAKSYHDVPYVQMSAFGGKGKPGYKVKTELHSPLLDLQEKTCKLRFSFADAYQNGQPLQVFLTNEKMKPLRNLKEEYWQDLVNNSERYDNAYEATPWIDLPKINQSYRICFTYDSKGEDNNVITTIIQLNEVDVWCE